MPLKRGIFQSNYKNNFSHPDFTVGIGITPIHAIKARGLYRRYGITPNPEVYENLSTLLL